MMKIELMHYTELCLDGEAERTSVVVIDDNKTFDFKTKGSTSSTLRACGLDLPCLKKALTSFKDFEIEENASIMVNGEDAEEEVIFHSQGWWVKRILFWKNMISENSVVVEKIEKIAQKDWSNEERSAIRLSREAVKHAGGNLIVAESKID
jgi:hypothetical protein